MHGVRMMHFFEKLQRDIDFQKEYEKLETMLSYEEHTLSRWESSTINNWIEKNFRKWSKRGNYISFSEVRSQLGFEIDESSYQDCITFRYGVGMEEYFCLAKCCLTSLTISRALL